MRYWQRFVFALCLCSASQATAGEIPLTLHDALVRTTEKTLDLQIERLTPQQSFQDYRKSQGIFDTNLTLSLDYAQARDVVYDLPTKTTQTGLGLSQLLVSGATAKVTATNNYYADQYSLGGTENYWRSGISLSVSQPLLKNFGRDTTMLPIDLARLTNESNREQYRAKLMTSLAATRSGYFALYGVREELTARKTSLKLAQQIETDTKARVAAGVLPAMELLNAAYGVATREKEVHDADRRYRDQEETLVQFLQLPVGSSLNLLDTPQEQAKRVTVREALDRAHAQRAELAQLTKELEAVRLQSTVAHAKVLPDLNLTVTGSSNGLENTFNRTMDRVGSLDRPAWEVGVTFSYPLGNRAADADYRKSLLAQQQKRLQLQQQQELIDNEVRAALRNLETAEKQLEVAKRGLGYAKERFTAWQTKVLVGMATNKDLLDVENDLTNARLTDIAARVSFEAAVTTVWKSTGVLIETLGFERGLVMKPVEEQN